MPLPERLVVLRKRIMDADADAAELVAGALAKILDFHGSRMLGPAVLAGRIVPMDWRPAPIEFQDLVRRILELIEETTRHPVVSLARKAKAILLSNIEVLTRLGWIDQLKPIVAASGLDEYDRALLVGKLRNFATWAKRPDGGQHKR